MEAIEIEELRSKLPLAYKGLAEALAQVGSLVELPTGHEVLREGQYVKFVPILLDGLVKVVTRGEMKDLLLYYIKPGESCMMSFIHALNQKPSNIYAVAEQPTKALIIPAQELEQLIKASADFNKLFHELSNQRYMDLLDTINEVFFLNFEDRLMKYLQNKSRLLNTNLINLTHQDIAQDLGTAREVVSRTLKKLEGSTKDTYWPRRHSAHVTLVTDFYPYLLVPSIMNSKIIRLLIACVLCAIVIFGIAHLIETLN